MPDVSASPCSRPSVPKPREVGTGGTIASERALRAEELCREDISLQNATARAKWAQLVAEWSFMRSDPVLMPMRGSKPQHGSGHWKWSKISPYKASEILYTGPSQANCPLCLLGPSVFLHFAFQGFLGLVQAKKANKVKK